MQKIQYIFVLMYIVVSVGFSFSQEPLWEIPAQRSDCHQFFFSKVNQSVVALTENTTMVCLNSQTGESKWEYDSLEKYARRRIWLWVRATGFKNVRKKAELAQL